MKLRMPVRGLSATEKLFAIGSTTSAPTEGLVDPRKSDPDFIPIDKVTAFHLRLAADAGLPFVAAGR